MDLAVTAADVRDAARRLTGRVHRTPVVALDRLGLWVKCESLQGIGAFKIRGATNAVLALRPAGVVTASSGNHGMAVAAAAAAAGIPAVVVMPANATAYKREEVARLGAEVVISPPETEARNAAALAVAEARGLTLIPAYDHPLVIAGQGTCGLEIAEQAGDAATVIVPLGGGGLLSGVAVALRDTRGARVRIVGVEPEDGDDTVRSLRAGRRVTVPAPRTICDGARNTTPGELTFPLVAALVDEVVAVTDPEVVDAVRALATAGLVVEPTGALAVAAALRGASTTGGGATVCVVTGRNIAPEEHARLVLGRV
ncbi:MAG TPA: pyridoxal-phosphate dependent enzyme [Candidatus Dormibacteraeota bacterium]